MGGRETERGSFDDAEEGEKDGGNWRLFEIQ